MTAKLIRYGPLAVLAAAATNTGAAPPDEIVLNGVVRDFLGSHADFDKAPAEGLGHCAANVNVWLDGNRYPLFRPGNGFMVADEWTDADGNNIAPHMAGVASGLIRETLGLRVDGMIELEKDTSIDAFNSNYGPYGLMGNYGLNAYVSTNGTAAGLVTLKNGSTIRGDVSVGPGGTAALVIENEGIITGGQDTLVEVHEMPDIGLPDDLLPRVDDGRYEDGVFRLEGDVTPDDGTDDEAMYFGDLTFRNTTVTIAGDLRIRCDGRLSFDKTQLVLEPQANLSFYVGDGVGSDDVEVKGGSTINVVPGDTTRVSINLIGPGEVKCDGKSHVYATTIAPAGQLRIKHQAQYYGGFVGKELKIENKGSAMHVDRGNAAPGDSNFALTVREEIEIDDDSLVDSFDSNDGPYGGANIGSKAWVSTNEVKNGKVKVKDSIVRGDVFAGPDCDPESVVKREGTGTVDGTIGNLAGPAAIPVVAPPLVGVSVGDIEYNGGTHVVSSDFRCKKLKLRNSAELLIVGNRTIRIDDKLEMDNSAMITLDEDSGSSLVLYIEKGAKIEKRATINMDTGNPQLVSIRMTSVGKKTSFEIKDRAQVCAWVQGAKTELNVEDRSDLYGSFTGRKIKVKKESAIHVDMAFRNTCIDLDDAAGSAGSDADGGITSIETFGEWFRNVLGVNQTHTHPITLVRDFFGVYECIDDSFHPIDDELLGNEGADHNHFFTYAVGGKFTFLACVDQFVEFEGGDGAWLFVDGRLVMDIGGMGTSAMQRVALDRLGLVDGDEYDLRLFYAQRRSATVTFRLRTNVVLSSDETIPSVTSMFD